MRPAPTTCLGLTRSNIVQLNMAQQRLQQIAGHGNFPRGLLEGKTAIVREFS